MKNRNQNNYVGRRISTLLLGVSVLTGALTTGAGATEEAAEVAARICPDYNIVVDGADQTFYDTQGQEVHPIVCDDVTYVSLGAIAELMNKNVNWDQSALTVSLSGTRTAEKAEGTPDERTEQEDISAQIRQDFTIVVDGTTRSFKDADGNVSYPLLYEGAIYLSVDAAGELLGSTVEWDEDTSTITLTTSSDVLVMDADSFNEAQDALSQPTASAQPDVPQTGQSAGLQANQPGVGGDTITAEAAKSAALAHAGLSADQVVFVKAGLDYDDGRLVFDVEFYSGNMEYDYEIDAYAGTVVSFDHDIEYYNIYAPSVDSSTQIGEEKARSIALAEVPGATADNVVKLRLDFDDGRYEYEVDIVYGTMEYDFEIDATSGRILSRDIDSIYD